MSVPPYDELPLRDGMRCSWEVWPGREVFGTLNRQTEEGVAGAATLIRRGAVFPLNLDMGLPGPPMFGRPPLQHVVRRKDERHSQDEVLNDYNTQSSTQWDGFRHMWHASEGSYGGLPDAAHGVHFWARRGIVGRAVLVDVAAWRASVGRPLDPEAAAAIEPDDVLATLAAQGSAVEPGDVLLLRTGWLAWYLGLDAAGRAAVAALEPARLRTPGLRPGVATARMLWDLQIAAVAADNPALEVWPSPVLRAPADDEPLAPDGSRPVEPMLHTHLLAMLGLPIGELFDLEALAQDCAADGRYACFFTSAPLNLEGGVASPPNAMALK